MTPPRCHASGVHGSRAQPSKNARRFSTFSRDIARAVFRA